MSEERDSAPTGPVLGIRTKLAADARTVALEFTVDGASAWATESGTNSIETILRALDDARSRMLDAVEDRPLAEKKYPSVFNPRWFVAPEPENRFAVLWLRSAGVGWYAYGIPRNEAVNLTRFLRKIPTFKTADDKRASLPPEASAVGSDEFLIATSGLGFYYYGKGDRRIGPDPFEQIEFDSDRAAGIVAGAIAEKRLEEALLMRMRQDQTSIAKDLFRPSGPLGPFRTKIDLAYMLGLLSDEAFGDFTTVKNIRNDFAHHLEMDTFDTQSISARCKNLVLVDRHIGPIPSPHGDQPERPSPYLGLPDHVEKLNDPRFRYIITTQLLSFRLGTSSIKPDGTLPLV